MEDLISMKIKQIFLILIFLFLVAILVLYKVIFISSVFLIPSFWTIYGFIATFFLISRIPYAYLYRDEHKKIYQDYSYPHVSIIIPVKNERNGILKTIIACISLNYPGKVECIVVDDGSTDDTKGEVIKAQKKYGKKRVKLIIFPKNKGKREAMAAGVYKALYEIIVFVDSDSFLAPNALQHIVEHFLDNERVGAVSGNTMVKNVETNLLTKMQSIKYAISFDIYKASESFFSSVSCCPGCFSAYRRKIIKPLLATWKNHSFLGSKSTFGDDRGLTNFVLRDGWEIIYCAKAKATTVVPKKFSIYWQQQLRWKKSWIREGIFACSFMWKNRHPLAILSFYTAFSFPFIIILLISRIIMQSVSAHNPFLIAIFVFGFLLLGMVFALFVRIHCKAKKWMYMPLVSLSFFLIFIWQMPWALITFKKTDWGTR